MMAQEAIVVSVPVFPLEILCSILSILFAENVANKKDIGWLKEWSLTITILGAMIITALV